MTDKELLELAAKAGGIKGEYVSWCYNGFKEGIREPNDKSSIPWNPLTDDGAALRLAVKLGISPDWGGFDVEICAKVSGARNFCYVEPHDTDSYAATRRAIVRAAAEIGRTL